MSTSVQIYNFSSSFDIEKPGKITIMACGSADCWSVQ